jgi:hypothetical protein
MNGFVGRPKLLVLIPVFICIFITACGTPEVQEEGAVVAPTGQSVLPNTPAPDEESTPESTQAPDREVSGSFGLVSLDQSLSDLSSYRMRSEISFTGVTIDDNPFDWTVTWETASSEQPPGSRLDITTEGLGPSSDISSMSLARVGGETYLAISDAGCVSGDDIGFQSASAAAINPDTFLSGLNGATLVAENQIVNNAASKVYQFDEEALPVWQNSSISVEGEIYLANASGFVSGIELTATGAADFAGLGAFQDGIFQLNVDISDVNEPLEIQPPLSCANRTDFPTPKDAFDVAYFEDLISYRSKMLLVDMADFYRKEMTTLGWTVIEDDELEDSATLTYQKDGIRITVFMTLAEDGKSVEVIISP